VKVNRHISTPFTIPSLTLYPPPPHYYYLDGGGEGYSDGEGDAGIDRTIS